LKNAYYSNSPPVQGQKFTNNPGVAVELFTPERIAENDAIFTSGVAIAVKYSTQGWLRSEQLKKSWHYSCADHL
jgi:hypothetical protein